MFFCLQGLHTPGDINGHSHRRATTAGALRENDPRRPGLSTGGAHSLQAAPALSQRLGNQILLKREDLQPTFSFKIRGAYNKLAHLSEAHKAHGVITASAGNHAQGVALAARELGIDACIVMPQSTPELKVIGVRSRGAQALLHGASFPFALEHALKLARESGRTFVSPFDDPQVIAGQGTVAMEILRQHPGRLDAIFVPVGGGGLIAGIAAYVKYLRPQIRIIGVESEHSACLQAAMAAGEPVMLPSVGASPMALRWHRSAPTVLPSAATTWIRC